MCTRTERALNDLYCTLCAPLRLTLPPLSPSVCVLAAPVLAMFLLLFRINAFGRLLQDKQEKRKTKCTEGAHRHVQEAEVEKTKKNGTESHTHTHTHNSLRGASNKLRKKEKELRAPKQRNKGQYVPQFALFLYLAVFSVFFVEHVVHDFCMCRRGTALLRRGGARPLQSTSQPQRRRAYPAPAQPF